MSPAETARAVERTAREVAEVVADEEVTFLAAAIAYYAFVSVLPALLLVLAVATAVGGDALADRLVAAGEAFLSPTGAAELSEAITSARGRTGATVAGVVLLLWSSLRVFRGLDIAFSRIYARAESPGLVEQVREALVVVASIGIAVASMLGIGGVLAATDLPVGGEVVGFVLLLLGLVAVFLPLYYVFPEADVGVLDVLPGAVLAAVGWVLLQAVFQLYADAAPAFELYGVIGGVLLLVTWFYVAATILLVGAVLNRVLARPNRQGQGAPSRIG